MAKPTIREVKILDANIENALKQYGISNLTLPLIKKTALLKAYYLKQYLNSYFPVII